MAFARYGHPQVEIPFDDPDSARRFALHHSRTTGEPVEVHGGTGQPTVFRRPAWRDGDFREFPAAAMCSVHGDPVTTTAHDTEADALAEADRQRGLRRVAVVWRVGEVEA